MKGHEKARHHMKESRKHAAMAEKHSRHAEKAMGSVKEMKEKSKPRGKRK